MVDKDHKEPLKWSIFRSKAEQLSNLYPKKLENGLYQKQKKEQEMERRTHVYKWNQV